MSWKLELVEVDQTSGSRRLEVGWLGEIFAPASIDDIGLVHALARRFLAELQRAVVALQETALQSQADRLRRLDPTLRLKDYRHHTVQSLHGRLEIRVPRLERIGTGDRAPALLGGSSRSTAEYRQILARLGAWMSFRSAARLIAELFPLASGGSTNTVRRRVFTAAAQIDAEGRADSVEAVTSARSIDLGMDTTFVRSCSPKGPRHHEVLIGVATADDGRMWRFGGAIAALDPPHRPIADVLRQLGRCAETSITAFTDGDKMLRGYLMKAGIQERPVPARRLRTAMTNLREYVDGQSAYLVDYANRQRAGKPVGTSTSEGLANALVNRRMNKLQQMRWSAAGAHAVVTVRLNAMNAPRQGGVVATAATA